jgi:AraC-like DNA-binding protein
VVDTLDGNLALVLWSAMMDPVTDLLQALRLTRSFCCLAQLSAPWGLAFPQRSCAGFHFVISGEFWLHLDSKPRHFGPGDLVLLPHGRPHQISDSPRTRPVPADELDYEKLSESCCLLRHGGPGEQALLLCGVMGFEGQLFHPLFEMLPDLLAVRASDSDTHGGLLRTLEALREESATGRPGSPAVITRLAEVLVLQTIRAWVESNQGLDIRWIGALRDPNIGRALAAIHKDPSGPWTLVSLAKVSGMSRSAFTARFTSLTGESPMQYVRRWRIYMAGALLREEHISHEEVASRTGYSSAASFSRAFRRYVGAAPGAVRKATTRRPG